MALPGRRLRPVLIALFLAVCAAAPLDAFTPPLGRRWQTFDTEHFQFYFYPETEPLARRLAPLAEQIHDTLVEDLGMAPRGTTHVLIYDVQDQANGAATVFPRNTIHLFATGDYAGGNGRIGDALLQTFVHEYTHILQMGYVTDVPEAITNVVGNVLLPNMYLPPWCLEGLAVVEESRLFASGRLNSSTWRMYLRADFLAGQTLTWPQATNGVYRWPYENAWYLYGSYFTAHLIERFGRDKVTEFYRATGGDLPFLSFAQCFEAVFGERLEQAVACWYREADAEFAREAERIEAAGLMEGTPVAAFGGRSGYGCFAPDGRLYFTKRTYAEAPSLAVSTPPYGRARSIAAVPAARPAVSPDGRRIVFGLASPHGDGHYNDLYLMELKSGRITRLTRGLRASDPAWSPDGREIAFIKNDPPNFSLYRLRLNDGQAIPVWRAEGLEQAFCPAWSPRGDQLVFARYRPADGLRLWSVRPDGSELAPLHEGAALGEEFDPAWSPDGRYVLFAADPTGVFNIHAYDTQTGGLRMVTNVLTGAYSPAVSPDGSTLAYTGYSARGYDQYVMPLDPGTWREQPPPAGPVPRDGLAPPPAVEKSWTPAPCDAPSRPYSPWPTLEPTLGYLMIQTKPDEPASLDLTLSGGDVLETVLYRLSVETDATDNGFRGELTWRLRSCDLSIAYESTSERDPPLDLRLRRRYATAAVSGGGSGLLSYNDSLSWRLSAYEDAFRPPTDAGYDPKTLRGTEFALAYGRVTAARGQVDLRRGFVLSGAAGREKLLETGVVTDWWEVENRLYLPVGRSRLELAAGLDWNSAAEAQVDLGLGVVPGPQGGLIWEAEACLELPLFWPEAGGAAAPGYLHAINGLFSAWGGQALDPAGPVELSCGLGLNFRLQLGYTLPLDLALMWVHPIDESGWYWGLWFRVYM